jgi:hypothetical protein
VSEPEEERSAEESSGDENNVQKLNGVGNSEELEVNGVEKQSEEENSAEEIDVDSSSDLESDSSEEEASSAPIC